MIFIIMEGQEGFAFSFVGELDTKGNVEEWPLSEYEYIADALNVHPDTVDLCITSSSGKNLIFKKKDASQLEKEGE